MDHRLFEMVGARGASVRLWQRGKARAAGLAVLYGLAEIARAPARKAD